MVAVSHIRQSVYDAGIRSWSLMRRLPRYTAYSRQRREPLPKNVLLHEGSFTQIAIQPSHINQLSYPNSRARVATAQPHRTIFVAPVGKSARVCRSNSKFQSNPLHWDGSIAARKGARVCAGIVASVTSNVSTCAVVWKSVSPRLQGSQIVG